MISKLNLKAYKSFPDITLDLKPLTLLSGLNSSGKSSILQTIRMYGDASQGNEALLKGHGLVSEIRSRLSPAKDPIEIKLTFSDGENGSLIIDDESTHKPTKQLNFSYVGADRLGPQTALPLTRSVNTTPVIGDKGEYVLDFLNKLEKAIVPDSLNRDKSKGNTLRFNVSDWLSEISPGVNFDFDVYEKTDSAQAKIDNSRPRNVGFGLSYTLPIIVSVLGHASSPPAFGWEKSWGKEWEERKNEGSIILLLENPEAHLHPRGQTAIGYFIALASQAGVQIIVETHSDHLMDGIRIAIKKNEIDADKVVFHYFSKTEEGRSEVQTPQIDENGKLEYWPEGFFDQTLKNRAILAKRN